jgi:AraC family transcriptional regulator
VFAAAEGMGLDPERVAIQPHLNAHDPRIEHLCRALEAELLTEEPFDRVYADGLGLALATQLIRHYAPLAGPRIGNGLSKGRLRKVTDYIGDNLTLDLSLSELADVASVSPSHFKMLFKASVGLPVHQYVIRRRVEYAIDLIVGGTLPLSDVALQAGFANQSHMARCMRRFAGVTPGALRHAGRGNRGSTQPHELRRPALAAVRASFERRSLLVRIRRNDQRRHGRIHRNALPRAA